MKLGAQLYTVRQDTQSLETMEECFKRIADMGYTTVQVSGTCKYDPDWMRELLDKTGLECPITHTDIPSIASDTDNVIEFHKKMGVKYIGMGGMRGLWSQEYKDDPFKVQDDFVRDYVPAGKKIASAGCYMMYHNHAGEFSPRPDGTLLMDYLLENFGEAEMGFTLDVHWVKAGGQDPVEWLNKLKGRTPCVHYKDLITDSEGKFKYAPVGTGELDFDAIIETSLKNGVEYAFVEQDDCYGEDPYKCLKTSIDYLHSKGLN